VCRHKTGIIRQTPALQRRLGPFEDLQPDAATLLAGRYRLVPADLREPRQVRAALGRAGADLGTPTLVLAECVLVYLEQAESRAALETVAALFPTAAVAVYEQIRPDDAFGRQMLRNLEVRGCPLLGICADLEAHRARLLSTGWTRAEVEDMGTVYRWVGWWGVWLSLLVEH
jgi:tRNA wybutosine-synthesizing protein 4